MKTETLMLISDAREVLGRVVTAEAPSNSLARAFLGWIAGDDNPATMLEQVALQAASAKGADRSSRTVAILGYTCGVASLRPRFTTEFSQQLEWLMGRPNFANGGEPSGVVTDPLSFAGVLVGAEAVVTNDARIRFDQWAANIWKDANGFLENGNWRRGLLDIIGGRINPVRHSRQGQFNIEPAWLSAALQRRGWGTPKETSVGDVLKTAIGESATVADAFEAGLRLEAIQWAVARVMDFDVSALTVKDVAGVLIRVPDIFQRWTWEAKPRTGRKEAEAIRWRIENEYHVQSLLYAVLKPVFQTLEEERYLVPTGVYQPRADLCLLSLRLLIEVKFWYRRDNARKLIEEIGADLSLYLRDESPYRQVIAVIWDDGARTEEHIELRRGLLGLNGLFDVVIINRPAFMSEPAIAPVKIKKRVADASKGTRAK